MRGSTRSDCIAQEHLADVNRPSQVVRTYLDDAFGYAFPFSHAKQTTFRDPQTSAGVSTFRTNRSGPMTMRPTCIATPSAKCHAGRPLEESRPPTEPPDRVSSVTQLMDILLRPRSGERAALQPATVHRSDLDRHYGPSRSGPHLHELRGAPELERPHDNAPLHAFVERLQPEYREPHGSRGPELLRLQFHQIHGRCGSRLRWAAGVTSRLFDVSDIVAMLEETESKEAA
jgi:hypothetical protein